MHRFGHPWIHGHPWGYGYDWWPGMFLSVLSTMFWIALFIGLAWILLRWILPYILPTIADIFGRSPTAPSALERLHQRYVAGEIDAVTFEQMRERLEASYQEGRKGFPLDDNSYPHETWSSYRDTFPSAGSREQGSLRMAEQEGYPSETER